MWLTKFKIALIEKDIEKLESLIDNIPQLNLEEMQEAIFLIKEASDIVYKLRKKTSDSMKQIQKNLNFLKSTQHTVSNKFDIRL